MDTPLTSEEIIRLVDSLSFFQQRKLGKAGFPQSGIKILAEDPSGRPTAEAVLACHTDLLRRDPRPGEAELAEAVRGHLPTPPLVRQQSMYDRNLSSGRGKRTGTPEELAEIEALLAAKKERDKAKKEAEREARRRK